MIFVSIDTQYASTADTPDKAMKEAAVYFRDELNAYLREEPTSDLVFVTEEEA